MQRLKINSCRSTSATAHNHASAMMAAVVIGPTQKPAAHCCGRVLGETIHFDENTTSDRTGQAKFELVLHRSQDGELLRLTTTFSFLMPRLWPGDPRLDLLRTRFLS